MAKIKVDTTGVESEPQAVKPGLYSAKVKEVELTESQKSGSPMLKVIYEISGGEHDGRVLFDYVMLDDSSMAWRLASFQDALGLKRKGEIDTDKLEGKKVQIRTVVQKSEEFGEQARVRNVLPPKGAARAEDLEDEEDEDEVDYEAMSLKELKAEIEAREIEVSGKETKAKLIKLLEENDEEEAESEDEEDDEDEAEDEEDDDAEAEDEDESDEDEEDEEGEDYSEMDLAELKKEIKKRKLTITGKATKAKLVAALEESDSEDEDEDDGEDEQDYDEMDLQELKDECKERGLKTAGKKAQLVARLEKDDESGDDGEPF